ncbi:MAG: hypothetical protein CMC14_14470 [Flavobacteriaceae bacterium]|nr:hypothetical protein [Flavobacteriaceae bacterium]|tara:strand:+ start:27208 stop:27882 length:675 start_codon:yes stop_codon:yes gene_type:complete
MYSNQRVGRITGALLLFIFISGVVIFQFLQGPVLFSDNFLTTTSQNSNPIIISVLLSILSGLATITVATLLLPIFKRHNPHLAYVYFAFCILGFIAIMIDNVSVISMLELSNEYVKNGNHTSVDMLETLVYQRHRWTHYFYLLLSCFPVFVLYYTLYLSKLVPRIISIFGIFAVILMFIEEVLSIFGHSISMNMLLPIALIQITLPLWLLFKGLNTPVLAKDNG